jgi:hypothetical protein
MEREAARFWGVFPWALRCMPSVRRAELIAHYREYHLRKAFIDHTVQRIMDKETKKPEKKTHNPYAMFGI